MSDSDSSSVTSTGSSRSSASGSSKSSGSSRSSSSRSRSSKSESSRSSRDSKNKFKRKENAKKAESSDSSSSSSSPSSSSDEAELVSPREKKIKEETTDDDVEFKLPRKTVKESSSEMDSGVDSRILSKPVVALESDFSPSATESGGEPDLMKRRRQGEDTDSEQAQKLPFIPPQVLARIDPQSRSGKMKSESESEFSDADKGGDSRISHATNYTIGTGTDRSSRADHELIRTGRPAVKEEITSNDESGSESSSSSSSTTSSSTRTSGKSSSGVSKGSSGISKGSKSSRKSGTSQDSSRKSNVSSSSATEESSSSDSSDTETTSSDSDGSSSESGSSQTSTSTGGSSTSEDSLIKPKPSDKAAPKSVVASTGATTNKPVTPSDVKIDLVENQKKPHHVKRKHSEEAEMDPDNFWIRLGRRTDKVVFDDLFVPIVGSITVICLIIFSIVIDVRLSGHTNIKYGYSFIPLMFAFLMWAILLFIGALSRVRYASSIQRPPNGSSQFERRWFNKEGARMGVFIFASLALVMAFIFLVITSAKVDGGKFPNSWRAPFIPLWILLGFIFVALLFSWRLMNGIFNLVIHILITGGITALTICVYLKIQGHLSADASWAKVLVPLWILDIFLLVVLFWHAFVRTVFWSSMHPTSAFRKHNKKGKKDNEEESAVDRASSVPLGVAGVFLFLFEVVIVAYFEGVFKGKFNVPWSFVWVWFWLACVFALVWVYTFSSATAKIQEKNRNSDEV